MKYTSFILLSILLGTTFSIAQRNHSCGTQERLIEQIRHNPGLEQLLNRYEQRILSGKEDALVQTDTEYTIPVVVHVVYHKSEQNVSDERIHEQIAVLNQDFSGNNPLTMGHFSPLLKANTRINFVLAKTAPDGSSTSGIERRQTPMVHFDSRDQMKFYSAGGLDAWDPMIYLNIWVCPLLNSGYGVFPGSGIDDVFGLVVHDDYFTGGDGNIYSLGGITSHEVGHCLNLRHTWGDDNGACTGSDLVDDTPNHANSSSLIGVGALTEEGVLLTDDCATASPGVMYMNFMDYGNDFCYANFTPGQKARMRANLESAGALSVLATSTAGNSPGSCTAPTNLRVTLVKKATATLRWTAMQNATSYNVRYRKSGTTTWTTTNTTTASLNLTGLTRSSTYEYQVQTISSSCSSAYSYISSFVTPRNDPATSISSPSIQYPSNGATSVPTDTTLWWSAVTGATGYQVQLSTNSDLSNGVSFNLVSGLRYCSISWLMGGTTYYWRVRAIAPDIVSAWSGTSSFTTVNMTLTVPTLEFPSDDSQSVRIPCKLQWSRTESDIAYELQISPNADMSGATTVYRRNRYSTRKDLDHATTYYWRVRNVRGEQASEWSQIRSFTTADSLLSPPTLVLPGNNSHENSTNPTLTWKVNPSAASYIVQYSTSSSFIGSSVVTTADTATSLANLSSNTKYYWRVRSVNGSDTSAWSATRYFTTEIVLTALQTPTLNSPADNSTNVSSSPTLTWNSVSNTSSYTLQYSTSSSMSPNTAVTSSSTSISLSGLLSNTVYYWRVKASASGYLDSDWSDVWDFKTAKGGRRKESASADEEITNDKLTVSMYPVPLESQAMITVTLPQRDLIRVVIVSGTMGEQIEVYNGPAELGTYNLVFNASDLSSGAYICQVFSSTDMTSIPFTVVR